jgi:hypothetical protein
MKHKSLALTTASVVICLGIISAKAQQPPGAVQPPSQQQGAGQDHPMASGGMMGHGMMGGMPAGGFMGGRAMRGGPLPMRIIFALMDSDGDGTISLQEFQAAHEKLFRAMDANKDGSLTLQEMLTFMRGSNRSAPAKARPQDNDDSGDEE